MREIEEELIKLGFLEDDLVFSGAELARTLKKVYNLGIEDSKNAAILLITPYDMESWTKKSLKDEDLLEYFIEDKEGNCTREGFEIEVDQSSILNLKIK